MARGDEEMSDGRYPGLAYLFRAYFHQNWAAEYWHVGETPTYEHVAAKVRAAEGPRVVAGIVADLDDVLSRDLSEGDLRALSRRLGSQYRPTGGGKRYEAWFLGLRAVLSAPRASEGRSG